MRKHQVCQRCIMNNTVPGVAFDNNGICNYCDLHDLMEKQYPNDERGVSHLEKMIDTIKARGKNKKYDCVLGISGGRDSTYTLYLAKKVWGLRPLAVHFNDGFGNPIAGKNMRIATSRLDVELRTITSDWKESKDLKIAFLKASTPDLEEGTDIGIASALYGVANKEGVSSLVIGQSFRTEGIAPLEWNYLDGKYLKTVHKQYGSNKLSSWKASDPGFNLDLKHMLYYTMFKRIKTYLPLYHMNYVRKEAEEILIRELDWKNPGAHYFDDLYQSLIFHLCRVKFKFDRRLANYSALVRSGQLSRENALERTSKIYEIEDPKIIDLCIKRIGLTIEEFEQFKSLPTKTFRDYSTNYSLIKACKLPILLLSRLNFIPRVTYEKYFHCG